MPEIKNTFLKSKMNKDLDARLVPNGEYRDAQNVSISRSEGSDVGALENVLGNRKLTSLKTNIGYLEDAKNVLRAPNAPVSGDVVLNGLEVIGYHMDTTNDRIFLFLTDYSDSSNDRLSNFAPGDITYQYQPPGNPPPAPETAFSAKGAACYIVQYNVSNNVSRILLGGNFLNFSKTHPIINVNMIENMLFWTDNRNQPRKINVDFANNDSYELSGAGNPYYYNEDHISVAKFAPFEAASFLDTSNESGLLNVSTEFLGSHIIGTLSNNTPIGNVNINFSATYTNSGANPDIKQFDKIIFPVQEDLGLTSEQQLIIDSVGSSPSTNSVTVSAGPTENIPADAVFEIQRKNPIYDVNYKGDENLLKDKFARFSYRFKYDDGEYSLMAPFTQAAFIPDQFGHFINDDENITLQTGNVKFMENSVTKVKLNIKLPEAANLIDTRFKIQEIQILAKNSDELAVRVVEDVPTSRLSSNTTVNYVYEYLSSKPIKVLPEADLIRVSDKIPVRALTQEVSGNRLIYGNFIDKHATPDYLEYALKYNKKTNNNFTKEFPNHTVKQNRSYQVGVVLYDRYGRASNVILSDPDTITTGFYNSTIYAPYSNFGTNSINYWGDFLEFTLKNPIPESGKQGYPGLYSTTNPLGYYSYRIVVKQQEQEYYNVYTPGALAGELIWDTKVENSSNLTEIQVTTNINDYLPSFHSKNRITLLNLFGDNINKIPRELQEVNGNDTTFDSRVILYNRVNPLYSSANGSYNTQSTVSKKGEKVVSIEPFRELGSWTTTKGNLFPYQGVDTQHDIPQPFYPYFTSSDGANDYSYNFHDIFFNASSNPFIAKIETDFKIGATPSYTTTVINTGSGQDTTQYKLKIERAWQDLGVFETEPTKSVLDIYYESSTSGLISEINANVSTIAPFSLRDSAGNDSVTGSLQYIQSENDPSGSPATLYFKAFDSSGNDCNDNTNTMSIVNVVDGSTPTNDRTTEFSIEQNPSNQQEFRIKTNGLFMYGENAITLESYTFTISVTANGFTNNLTLNNCRLVNDPPVLSQIYLNTGGQLSSVPSPLYPSPISITNIQDFEVLRFTAKNGSADTSRDTEQLVCKVADNIGDPYSSDWFYVDNIRANGTTLPNNQFVVKVDANTANTHFASNPNSTYSINLQIKVYDSNETSVPAGLNLISRTVEFTDQ
tara:strand:+ start:25 stop:3552 length:3528 start_codon:yes stop_codon:yes gene_type:complete